jgi:hypothetical protein
MLYTKHTHEQNVISYYLEVYKYFNKDMRDLYDFITLSSTGNEMGYKGVISKPYIIPIHKTKCVDSCFMEHIYWEHAKPLLRNREMIEGVERYYCETCKKNKDGTLKLARVIKNECLKSSKATKCKSCYLGINR